MAYTIYGGSGHKTDWKNERIDSIRPANLFNRKDGCVESICKHSYGGAPAEGR